MSTEVAIRTKKDALTHFNKVKEEISDLTNNASNIEVNDDSSMAISTNIIKELKDVLTKVETIRKIIKEPSILEGKMIDAAAKELTEEANVVLKQAKEKLLRYQLQRETERLKAIKEAEAKEKEAQDKINARKLHLAGIGDTLRRYELEAIAEINKAITKTDLAPIYKKYVIGFPPASEWEDLAPQAEDTVLRIKVAGTERINWIRQIEAAAEEEDSALIAELNEIENERLGIQKEKVKEEFTAIDEEIAVKATEEAIEVQSSAVVDIASLTLNKTTGLRRTWTYEVLNERNIPREWLMLDEKKVKNYLDVQKEELEAQLKETPDGIDFNGIRFYKKISN